MCVYSVVVMILLCEFTALHLSYCCLVYDVVGMVLFVCIWCCRYGIVVRVYGVVVILLRVYTAL